MSQRFEGKNVEEALGQAAEAFGVERYRLTYHVVVEKRGFLGGVKRVVIEAEVNEGAMEPPPQAAVASSPSAPPTSRARSDRPRGGGGGRGRDDKRGGSRDRDRDRGGDRGRRRGPREDAEPFFEPFDPEDVPVQGEETEAAKSVRQWCEEALRHGHFDIILRTDENEKQINVKLYGHDSRRFLDRHGELLDALQVLANKALVGRRIEKDIELDCSGFKERRMEEIGERARETADRVRRDGREQLLPAMSPIERRIVHLTLQDDPDVMTESQGDGFLKRVAIKPRAQQPTTSES